jgi:predicted site-specific integrase-resolvase
MAFLKTRAVCELLGVRYTYLANWLRDGRLTPPAKDSSGDFIWTPEDIERARAALTARRRRGEAVAHA